jgi:acetyltransferase-like isoleucine patch superfamily enzyme
MNTNFNGMVVYGPGAVSIGDNFHSGSGCKIITQSHNYDGDSVPYDDTYKTFTVCIEDNVWLGMDVTIIGNVTIGEGAIIQVGSVVVSDIPRCAIAGGHPARVFASRDVEKYARLVREKKFH